LFKPYPDLEQVIIYFSQKGMNLAEAEMFYNSCRERQWQFRNGAPVLRWKQAALLWITAFQEKQPWLFDKNIH